jgi:hypothetical protein
VKGEDSATISSILISRIWPSRRMCKKLSKEVTLSDGLYLAAYIMTLKEAW